MRSPLYSVKIWQKRNERTPGHFGYLHHDNSPLTCVLSNHGSCVIDNNRSEKQQQVEKNSTMTNRVD